MKFAVFVTALLAVALAEEPKHTPPKVQVYSHQPGQFGEKNTLICKVSGFHPPDISIQLMMNGMEIPNAVQTDLAFKQNWHFHLTKSAAFKPMREEKYNCRVTHGDTVKDYAWDPNM